MNIPSQLKYTKDHEWISLEGDIATVGITDFAQRELGDIVYVEVETIGETLSADEVFGTVEAVKTVSDLFLPVSGEISAPAISNSGSFFLTSSMVLSLRSTPFDLPCKNILFKLANSFS